jgi:hypothetical protein
MRIVSPEFAPEFGVPGIRASLFLENVGSPGGRPMTENNTTEPIWAREMQPGERIQWSGTPQQGLLLRGSDAFLIPFSLLWGGFAFFWEFMVNAQGAPLLFRLWGIPFVLVGVYLIVGRFFWDKVQRVHTFYCVTNKRALIRSGIFSSTLQTVAIHNLSEISVSEKADGKGTITFGPADPFKGVSFGWSRRGSPPSPSFDMIPDVRRVYDLLQTAERSGDTIHN